MKFWIGRTKANIPDDIYEFIERHEEKRILYTKLYAFYDKPSMNSMEDARKMCEIPNYMFPQIEENKIVEFTNIELQ